MGRKYTILLALCDGEKYLPDFLQSIKNQVYTNWELVAFDDSSGTECESIIRRFSHETENSVYYRRNTPQSGSARGNFSRLIQYAAEKRCAYVMPADQDDVWDRMKLSIFDKRMDKLEARYGTRIPLCVHSDLRVTDENLNEISPSLTKYQNLYIHGSANHILIQNNVTGCACLMNAPLAEAISDRLSDSKVIMHDHFAAVYASVFGRVSYIGAPLVSYRQHSDNSVGAKDSGNLLFLMKRLFKGRRDYRMQMHASFEQSAFFYQCYRDVPCRGSVEDKLLMTYDYGSLEYKGKAERLSVYFRYGIWKKGAVRRIVQFIWG